MSCFHCHLVEKT